MGRDHKKLREDGVPILVEWLAQQHNNTDPVRAQAARAVSERWPFTNGYHHTDVMKTLATEESEHLLGMRLLTEDYSVQWGLEADEQFREVGLIAPLVPAYQEQCGHMFKGGKFCTRDAVPGAGRCGYHGGSYMNETERADMVEQISARLVDVSDRAIAVMIDLMDNARSEKVRFDAALSIIDRIGLAPVQKVELGVTSSAEEAAAELRGRLIRLAARDGVIVPGEVDSVTDEPFPDVEVEGA